MERLGRIIARIEILNYDDDGNLIGSRMLPQEAVLHYPHAEQLGSLIGQITKGLEDEEGLPERTGD